MGCDLQNIREMLNMSLPFYLTFMRIIMGPFFLMVYVSPNLFGIQPTFLPYVLLLILIICELSDILDGFLARRNNTVTDLGKILDPMADSMFRLSVFLSFTRSPVHLPLMVVLAFFLRDFLIATLRMLCALKGIALGARLSGKVKAVTQGAVAFFILALMIPYSQGWIEEQIFEQLSFYAASFAAIYTVLSGIEYIWVEWDRIHSSLLESHDNRSR